MPPTSLADLFRIPVVLALLGLCLTAAAEAPSQRVQSLAEIAIYPERNAPATVVSLNQPRISAEIAATVAELPVRVGDKVDKGQLLAALDCRQYRATQRLAAANLVRAEALQRQAAKRLQRARELAADDLLSAEDLESRDADLAALKADLAANRANLDLADINVQRCRLVAPFAGIVTERSVSVGEAVAPGQALLALLDQTTLEISAQVPANQAARLQSDQTFELHSQGQVFPLRLRKRVDALNPNSRNREVRLEFDAAPALPGSAGKLVWRDPRPHLPARLLVNRGGQLGVFLDDGGKARFLALPEAQFGRINPVTFGVSTRLVTSGQLGLSDGDPLR